MYNDHIFFVYQTFNLFYNLMMMGNEKIEFKIKMFISSITSKKLHKNKENTDWCVEKCETFIYIKYLDHYSLTIDSGLKKANKTFFVLFSDTFLAV
jgi:hypothetical protein